MKRHANVTLSETRTKSKSKPPSVSLEEDLAGGLQVFSDPLDLRREVRDRNVSLYLSLAVHRLIDL